jgi:hypothetical protein
MFAYALFLDLLPEPGELRRVLSEVYTVPLDGVYVGKMFEGDGGPPATVYFGFIETDGGDFIWRAEVSTDHTVAGPAEPVVAAALARRFGMRVLLPVETGDAERWRLFSADGDQWVDLDLDELDEDRYAVVGPSR